MEQLTVAMENYLEAVYELSADGSGSRVSDIATRMNVSKASVNSAMNVLASKGLVENEKYREVRLTEHGLEVARLTSGKHAILQCLLTDIMGVSPGVACEDACAIEHVISMESVRKIYEFLQRQELTSLPSQL